MISVSRALEKVKGHVGFKTPKTERGVRQIAIDARLRDQLLAEREKYLRIAAGVSAKADVDLSLVKLPADNLIFPAPGSGDFKKPRADRAVTKLFSLRAKRLGFANLRLHDLRGSHATILLRKRLPIDVVARRLGHHPKVLLTAYAKAIPTDDQQVREALQSMFGADGK
jgi:integrase